MPKLRFCGPKSEVSSDLAIVFFVAAGIAAVRFDLPDFGIVLPRGLATPPTLLRRRWIEFSFSSTQPSQEIDQLHSCSCRPVDTETITSRVGRLHRHWPRLRLRRHRWRRRRHLIAAPTSRSARGAELPRRCAQAQAQESIRLCPLSL